MDCVVYAIKNLNDMKLYVGSSKELSRRKTDHFYALSHGKHNNPHLQNAWNKDGEYAFVFSVLEVIDDPSLLREREQLWLNHLTPWGYYGYNIRKDTSDGRRGTICPEEIRKKISQSLKGRVRSEEHRRNNALAKTGKPCSADTKAKISESRKNQRCGSSNHKAKLTENDVVNIRKRLDVGEIGLSLAREYGVNRVTIYQIRDNATWKHVINGGFCPHQEKI